MPKIDKKLKLEEKIEKITQIVENLDKGDKSLEELIDAYEIGIEYAQSAKEDLNVFEQKIIDITQKYKNESE
jgi:exodeoxyribonuclease VII small subunit